MVGQSGISAADIDDFRSGQSVRGDRIRRGTRGSRHHPAVPRSSELRPVRRRPLHARSLARIRSPLRIGGRRILPRQQEHGLFVRCPTAAAIAGAVFQRAARRRLPARLVVVCAGRSRLCRRRPSDQFLAPALEPRRQWPLSCLWRAGLTVSVIAGLRYLDLAKAFRLPPPKTCCRLGTASFTAPTISRPGISSSVRNWV